MSATLPLIFSHECNISCYYNGSVKTLERYVIINMDLYFICVVTEIGRLDDPVFMNRNLGIPSILRFHPYESHLVVGDKDHIWYVQFI